MKKEKQNQGITLIALVITIIVLLILAGITIATLTGDNGLLTKAGNAKNTSTEAEIGEKIRLAYQDYYLGQHTNPVYSFQDALNSMFGTGIATASGPDSNGVYTVSVNGKLYEFNSATGIAEEYIDVIKYYDTSDNEIAKTDLTHLDHLVIGETEKFKVISTTNGILAMPYYNLVRVIADGTVKQGPEVANISERISSTFSESIYWTQGDDKIDTTNSNIQQYITKYKTTLEGLGAKGISIRLASKSELEVDGVTDTMRNPSSEIGVFWLRSDWAEEHDVGGIWCINALGRFTNSRYYNDVYQVRPVIEIH